MNYQPFDIGENFRITPPGAEPAPAKNDIVMQRGAFGSGEHETTESCLAIMEGLKGLSGARILDLGSGTGILAIAALKLGADHVVCVDIDASAVETAKTNCRLNGVEEKVTHIVGTLDHVDKSDFDVILANIYGDILLMLAEPLVGKLKKGGTLLLSGILWEHNFDVRQAYEQQGSVVLKNKMLGEFSTLLLNKG